jgi:predicted nuclease of predicted toxin-antitoxin system
VRFKLDENFDARLSALVSEGGHEVDTVLGEGLSGKPDGEVYDACRRGARVLLTLDLDFSNPIRFPPEGTEGIVVVRAPAPCFPSSKRSSRRPCRSSNRAS